MRVGVCLVLQDFRVMMANFAMTQAQLVQVSADMWRATAAQFGVGPAVPEGEGAAAAGSS